MDSKGHEVAIKVSQDAAMKAGKNDWGWIIIQVDAAELSDDERAAFALLPTGRTSGFPHDDIKRIGGAVWEAGVDEATVETLKALLRGRIKREQKLIDAWMATPLNELIDRGTHYHSPKSRTDYFYRPSADYRGSQGYDTFAASYPQLLDLRREEIDAWIAADLQQWQDQIHADREEHQAAAEERQAAEEAEREAKRAYVATIVATHGDANMQARHEAGMLWLGEVLNMAEAFIFAPLADEPRFAKLTDIDLKKHDDYGCTSDDVDFTETISDVATAAQWDRLQSLKKKLGRDDAALSIRRHVGASLCAGPIRRYGVRIAISEGGYDFIREYACPGGLEQPAEENG